MLRLILEDQAFILTLWMFPVILAIGVTIAALFAAIIEVVICRVGGWNVP